MMESQLIARTATEVRAAARGSFNLLKTEIFFLRTRLPGRRAEMTFLWPLTISNHLKWIEPTHTWPEGSRRAQTRVSSDSSCALYLLFWFVRCCQRRGTLPVFIRCDGRGSSCDVWSQSPQEVCAAVEVHLCSTALCPELKGWRRCRGDGAATTDLLLSMCVSLT